MKPVRLISRRFAHHAAKSGYHHLARNGPGIIFRENFVDKLAAKWALKNFVDLPAISNDWYTHEALSREVAICLRAALSRKANIWHWLYAENDLRIAPAWKWRGHQIFVATFHQPPAYLKTHFDTAIPISGLDAGFAVANCQVSYLEQFLPPEKVFVIPHGIDVDYWRPAPSVDRALRPTLVFVGTWFRDFLAARQIILSLMQIHKDVEFRVVSSPQALEHFRGLQNTTLLSSITDDQLRTEYRRAHALFVPLEAATANNSILECMACGTAVVTSSVGGTPEYVDRSCGFLFDPGDHDCAVEYLSRLVQSRQLVDRLGVGARARAELLGWERICALQDSIYKRLLSRRSAALPCSPAPLPTSCWKY